METLLGGWDLLVNGIAEQMISNVGMKGMYAEVFFAFVFIRSGLWGSIRRMPLMAHLLCPPSVDNTELKEVRATATGLNDTGSIGDGRGVVCQPGGPKYRMEFLFAESVGFCVGDLPWSWEAIWGCWCYQKAVRGMLEYSEYELCVRARNICLASGSLVRQ